MPVMVEVMKQNLLMGYGFSRATMIYYDNDFGFLNTILMFGVAGLSFLIFFFVKLFTLLIAVIKRVSASNSLKLPLKIIAIAWVGVLIGYFTTWDFFTWYFYKVFFVAVLIALSETFVMQANTEDVQMRIAE